MRRSNMVAGVLGACMTLAGVAADAGSLSGQVFCWHDAYESGMSNYQKQVHDAHFQSDCHDLMVNGSAGSYGFDQVDVGEFFWLTAEDLEDLGASIDPTVEDELPSMFCCHTRGATRSGTTRHKKYNGRNWTESWLEAQFGLGENPPPCAKLGEMKPDAADWAFLIVSQNYSTWFSKILSGNWHLESYTDRALRPCVHGNSYSEQRQDFRFEATSYAEPSWGVCSSRAGVVGGRMGVWYSSFSGMPFAMSYPHKNLITNSTSWVDIDEYWDVSGASFQQINHVFGWRWRVANQGVLDQFAACNEENKECGGIDFTLGPSYLMKQNEDQPYWDQYPSARFDRGGVCAWVDLTTDPDAPGLRPEGTGECIRMGFVPVAIE